MSKPNQTAAGKYTQSVQHLFDLASKPSPKPLMFDTLIVGSGYGGAISAAALSGYLNNLSAEVPKRKICVLERGLEYLPGEFPASMAELPKHTRLVSQALGDVRANPEGLFDFRIGDDVSALLVNGVGGGSLINAGVLVEPDAPPPPAPDSPVENHWATVLGRLKKGTFFDRAAIALEAKVRDANGKPVKNTIRQFASIINQQGGFRGFLAKTEALHSLADDAASIPVTEAPDDRFPPISIAHSDTECGLGGQTYAACNLCGDCMTGCNVGAKKSLDANLLRRAAKRGVSVYTGATVTRISRDETHSAWTVHIAHTNPTLQRRLSEPVRILAKNVILAAGSLGSTEILMRSRSESLPFSPTLGTRFSCNGDNLAAVYDMQTAPTFGNAPDDSSLDQRRVGPTITASIKVNAGGAGRGPIHSYLLQEFAIPAPLSKLMREILATSSLFHDVSTRDASAHRPAIAPEYGVDPLAPDETRIARSLVVGLIGHDESNGVLELPHTQYGPDRHQNIAPPSVGTLQIRWPDVRHSPHLIAAFDALQSKVDALHARNSATSEARNDGPATRLIANPVWRLLPPKLEQLVSQPRGPAITVHPLGGCPIGPNVHHGVVNEFGAVYDPRKAATAAESTYEGLYVLDGAVIPKSLGANPALTIAALALQGVEDIVRREQQVPEGQPLPTHFAVDLPDPVFSGARSIVPPRENPPATPTEVRVIERLRGTAYGLPSVGTTEPAEDYEIELTLAYQPKALHALIKPLYKRLDVDITHPESVIRVFRRSDWDEKHLDLAPESQKRAYALASARLKNGHLALLNREASQPWVRTIKSLWAYLLNRGVRDIWQLWLPQKPTVCMPQGAALKAKGPKLSDRLFDALRLSSRAGEVRTFLYDLTPENWVLDPSLKREAQNQARELITKLLDNNRLTGRKRLTYNRRANPWKQLSELTLTSVKGIARPVLNLDLRFLADQQVPLIAVAKQRDHFTALVDLACFGSYLARLLISIHLWTFRMPEDNTTPEPDRLPRDITGLPAPEITELIVDTYPSADRKPVKIRLTRYRQRPPGFVAETPSTNLTENADQNPIVMIHGYSVGANTFTHASIPTSAAQYFAQQGRDVWVLDLRTSTGLPSCQDPWSYEQVALVDIPAALLHVRKVTGKRVDVLAHCIGSAMLSMALMTRAEEIRNSTIQLGVDTWLTDTQLAQLDAFNAQERGRHSTIRRVVLSQKGPFLKYTDQNIFRAYLMQTVRRWFFTDAYQFRQPRNTSVGDQLLDRLLASLPYPNADYDIENAMWRRTPWTQSRHRMDLLYGQDFAAANLTPATLNAIDELFGPLNLDTLAQTIHFANKRVITNQQGQGEFVTLERLRERWGCIESTLGIHGRDNGLISVETQALLKRNFNHANVNFTSLILDGYGHQDVLIGARSVEVFQKIDAFLSARASS